MGAAVAPRPSTDWSCDAQYSRKRRTPAPVARPAADTDDALRLIQATPAIEQPRVRAPLEAGLVPVKRCHDFIRRYIHWKPGNEYSRSDHVPISLPALPRSASPRRARPCPLLRLAFFVSDNDPLLRFSKIAFTPTSPSVILNRRPHKKTCSAKPIAKEHAAPVRHLVDHAVLLRPFPPFRSSPNSSPRPWSFVPKARGADWRLCRPPSSPLTRRCPPPRCREKPMSFATARGRPRRPRRSRRSGPAAPRRRPARSGPAPRPDPGILVGVRALAARRRRARPRRSGRSATRLRAGAVAPAVRAVPRRAQRPRSRAPPPPPPRLRRPRRPATAQRCHCWHCWLGACPLVGRDVGTHSVLTFTSMFPVQSVPAPKTSVSTY